MNKRDNNNIISGKNNKLIKPDDKLPNSFKDLSKPNITRMRSIVYAVIPIVISLAIFFYLSMTKKVSGTSNDTMDIRKVRIMKATPVTVQRIAVGYGRVTPLREWTGFSEVKGKVICVGFSFFRTEDITDINGFVNVLKNGENTMSKFVLDRFPQNVKTLIINHDTSLPIPELFKNDIVFGLNNIIKDENLYAEDDFSNIILNKDIKELVTQNLQGQDLIRLNRKILSLAFSDYLMQGRYFNIDEGQFIPKGAVICQIDPTEYNLFIEQKSIGIERNQIQIRELKKEEEHLNKILKLEQQRAELLKTEYERKQKIFEQQAFSKSEVERDLNNYLHQLNAIEDIKSTLDVLPIKIKNIDASIRHASLQLKQARLDLEKTVLVAPFDLRITDKNIELNQFVSPGQILIKGYGIDAVDIYGQFQINDVINQVFDQEITFDFHEFINLGSKAFLEDINIDALVNLSVPWINRGDKNIEWHGKVTRVLSSVDKTSQTVPIVVTVKDPYKNMIPGVRPALVKGRYCKIILLGKKEEKRFCIPREAYQEGSVLLLDDGKLKLANIKVEFFQDDYVVVNKGINEGDSIILSDLFPAIPNMSLIGVDKTDEVKNSYPWFIALTE